MSEIDLEKFESRLDSGRQTKEQKLFETVLAAAIAADRRGFFVEPQTVKDQTNDIELEDIELVWQTGKFQRSLEDRGIASTKNPNLTLRQETFLQAYLNPLNLKPPQTVAKQMKVSTVELDGWMRQKHFAEAMSAKSEENLRKYIPMADQALGQLVQQGDMKAITFVNQLTGRFDANAKSQVDIAAVLLAMQEIIQKHVRDPITRRNIARELISLAQGNSGSTAIPEPMPDAIMSEETTVEINTKD
jgi:hypothetical protein|tara:strand:+ start:1017 stop:1754 length:738 start_codon:yes stop_codon:yes gene_type:complete